jgi:two-component system, NtrC family, response regulator HydG
MSSAARPRVLVVDDHPAMARMLADQLEEAGYAVQVAEGGAAALEAARAELPDVVLTDLRMQEVDGLDVLAGVKALDPVVPVIIMTGFGAVESAIEAIKRGAFHYLTKPFQKKEVLLYVERALADRRLRDENRSLRRVAVERSGFGSLVGQSAPMRALYERMERVAAAAVPVLVRGESGTGKELVARALHFEGPRRDRPFVAINCTALPESLLESELFGHAKGSFTGATAGRRGLFVEADGGTLFLDEIGDMPPALQAKLLRAIEEGEVRAVGSDASRTVDVRIVAATHQDLEERIRAGQFRSDLYYRLNVLSLSVPPLRERPEDVPLLVERFLARARERNPASRVVRFAPALISRLAACRWPGNVRELENVVERIVVLGEREEAGVEELLAHAPQVADDSSPLAAAKERIVTLRQLEAEYIGWVIARCGGNKTRAAELLGIDVSTIHRREKERGARGEPAPATDPSA